MTIEPDLSSPQYNVPIGEEEMNELVGCVRALKTISRYLREDTGLSHGHDSEPVIALDWLTDTLSMIVSRLEQRHDDASGFTALKAKKKGG